MYGIHANIWGILMVNLTIYVIHTDPSWEWDVSWCQGPSEGRQLRGFFRNFGELRDPRGMRNFDQLNEINDHEDTIPDAYAYIYILYILYIYIDIYTHNFYIYIYICRYIFIPSSIFC